MRLVGRAPRSPVLHELALRRRAVRSLQMRLVPRRFAPEVAPYRSTANAVSLSRLLMLRARSGPHWFVRQSSRCSQARDDWLLVRPSLRRLRFLRPLTLSPVAGSPVSLPPTAYAFSGRSGARSFRPLFVHPAYFALLGRRVPRRLVARSAARRREPAQDTPRIGDLRSRRCVPYPRGAATHPTHSYPAVSLRR